MSGVKRYDPVSDAALVYGLTGDIVMATDFDAEHDLRLEAERQVGELREQLGAARDARDYAMADREELQAKLSTLEQAVFRTLDNSGDGRDYPFDITIMKMDFDLLCELVPADWEGADTTSAEGKDHD